MYIDDGMKKEPTLDLHGYKFIDVVDAVDRFIMKHHTKRRVRIMPGKGTGKVKSEVINYLKLGGYPWEYEQLANGSRNQGVLVVFLGD